MFHVKHRDSPTRRLGESTSSRHVDQHRPLRPTPPACRHADQHTQPHDQPSRARVVPTPRHRTVSPGPATPHTLPAPVRECSHPPQPDPAASTISSHPCRRHRPPTGSRIPQSAAVQRPRCPTRPAAATLTVVGSASRRCPASALLPRPALRPSLQLHHQATRRFLRQLLRRLASPRIREVSGSLFGRQPLQLDRQLQRCRLQSHFAISSLPGSALPHPDPTHRARLTVHPDRGRGYGAGSRLPAPGASPYVRRRARLTLPAGGSRRALIRRPARAFGLRLPLPLPAPALAPTAASGSAAITVSAPASQPRVPPSLRPRFAALRPPAPFPLASARVAAGLRLPTPAPRFRIPLLALALAHDLASGPAPSLSLGPSSTRLLTPLLPRLPPSAFLLPPSGSGFRIGLRFRSGFRFQLQLLVPTHASRPALHPPSLGPASRLPVPAPPPGLRLSQRGEPPRPSLTAAHRAPLWFCYRSLGLPTPASHSRRPLPTLGPLSRSGSRFRPCSWLPHGSHSRLTAHGHPQPRTPPPY
jgi:hypothetical protein